MEILWILFNIWKNKGYYINFYIIILMKSNLYINYKIYLD